MKLVTLSSFGDVLYRTAVTDDVLIALLVEDAKRVRIDVEVTAMSTPEQVFAFLHQLPEVTA